MPLIEYTEPRIHVVQGSPGHKFEFHPGAENEVPDKLWADLQANSPGTKHMLRSGKLKVVTVRMLKSTGAPSGAKDGTHVSDNVPVSDKFPKGHRRPTPVVDGEPTGEPVTISSIKEVDIALMTSWDAVEFVKKVYTEETLERFRKAEEGRRGGARRTVITALDEQLTLMRTDPTKGSSLAASA